MILNSRIETPLLAETTQRYDKMLTKHQNTEGQEFIATREWGCRLGVCSMQMESPDRLQAKWQGRRIHFLGQRYFRKLRIKLL